MPETLTLFTCALDRGGPPFHPCRRCHKALEEAGHRYDTRVFDKNRPFGFFTSGKRPDLEQMTGQEKLPVLQLPDGNFIAGSGEIMAWARETAPTPA